MVKILYLLGLLLFSLLLILSCNEKSTEPKSTHPIVGTWQSRTPATVDDDDELYEFTFHSTGKLTGTVTDYDWDDTAGQWIPDDVETVDGNGDTYFLDKDYIKISIDQMFDGYRDVDENWFKFTINNKQMTWYNGAVFTGESTSLIGTWEMKLKDADDSNQIVYDTVVITFTENGDLISVENGETAMMAYEDNGSTFTFSTDDEEVTAAYTIDDGKLYLYFTEGSNSQTITFNKQ